MTRTRVLQEIRRMRFKESMCFVEEEGTASSFQGMVEVIERWGCPQARTPGGKVERDNPEPYSTTVSP